MTATENRRRQYLWETPYKKGVKSDFFDPQGPNARHKIRRPRPPSITLQVSSRCAVTGAGRRAAGQWRS
ncbi:hypothetical protein METHP14_910009 [Pseudomonas sp. P14-2025]